MSEANKRRPVPADTAMEPAPAPPPPTTEGAEASPATETALAPLPPATEGAQVEARTLLAFDGYEPNDVVMVATGDVKNLVKQGLIDPHPAAVSYAKSLKADG